MLHLKYVVIGIFFVFLFSCKVQEPVTKSYHLNDAGTISQNAIVYSIPKTILQIQVKIIKKTFIAGPFAQYGKKYLGIDNIQSSDLNYFLLDDIELSTCEDIDPDNFYIIENTPLNKSNLITFSKFGLVSNIDKDALKDCSFENIILDSAFKIPAFTDLSVKKNLQIKYDTIYKRVMKDSAFVKIPVIKPKTENRTLEEKAEDAANFIIKLRKRRFKLISGQYDFYPESQALELAINGLSNLEQEYLSLFIGKWFEESAVYNFEYYPEEVVSVDTRILFRFSEKDGILPKISKNGRPVFIVLNKLDDTEKLNEFIDRQNIINYEANNEKIEKIYYRIPEKVLVEIIDGQNLLLKSKISISQFGRIISVPVKFNFN